MTNCDFSGRSARDEMRDTIGSNEPDAIIGPDKDQNKRMQEEGQVITRNYCVSCTKCQRRAVATSCMSRHLK